MYDTPAEALSDLTTSYPILQSLRASLHAAFQKISVSLSRGGTLYVGGNGGSAADAEHIAGEMLKGFLSLRPLPMKEKEQLRGLDSELGNYLAGHLQSGLRCIALTSHPAFSSAVGNDLGGDLSFAQQMNALCRPGDVFLGISTSGNARNVQLAALVAKAKGLTVVSLTGENGGILAGLADVALKAPGTETYKIQELHLPIYHTLCIMLETHFFSEPPKE